MCNLLLDVKLPGSCSNVPARAQDCGCAQVLLAAHALPAVDVLMPLARCCGRGQKHCIGSKQSPGSVLGQATECRLAGNVEARGGNLARAVELYTAGLEAASQRGRHLLLANRAGARLALGDAAGAAADADEAAALAPPGFTTCYIRQARVLLGVSVLHSFPRLCLFGV